MMKKIAGLLAMLSVAFALTACNTVAGVGKDVKATGDGVTEAAKDTQKKM